MRAGGRDSIGDGSRGLRPAGRPAARIGQLFAHRDGWGRRPWGGGLAPASTACDAERPAAGPGAGRGDRGPTSPRQTGGGEGQLGSERTGRSSATCCRWGRCVCAATGLRPRIHRPKLTSSEQTDSRPARAAFFPLSTTQTQ